MTLAIASEIYRFAATVRYRLTRVYVRACSAIKFKKSYR